MSAFHHPWGNQPQSISNLLLFKYPGQYLSMLKAMNALTVVVPDAIELLLAFSDLPLEAFQRVHRALEARHLSEE